MSVNQRRKYISVNKTSTACAAYHRVQLWMSKVFQLRDKKGDHLIRKKAKSYNSLILLNLGNTQCYKNCHQVQIRYWKEKNHSEFLLPNRKISVENTTFTAF